MPRLASSLRILSLALVLAVSLIVASPAYASQAVCTAGGGSWDGTDSQTGKCTYPPTASITLSSCGTLPHRYVVTFVAAVETKAVCKPVQGGGYTSVHSGGGQAASLTLRLRNGKGQVTFPKGCPRNCSINSTLPDGPGKDTIIVTPLAVMYVRAGGETNSYTICFRNMTPGGGSVRIYRYAGGIWTPISAPSTASLVCASAAGDGSFYLH